MSTARHSLKRRAQFDSDDDDLDVAGLPSSSGGEAAARGTGSAVRAGAARPATGRRGRDESDEEDELAAGELAIFVILFMT